MRVRTLMWFYGRRLRVHWMQELLAGAGIAAGVALVFAVQVANSSITGSARQMLQTISGAATLQVTARDSNGFDEGLAERIRALPGVEGAAPILEQRATLVHRGHRVPIDLVGVDERLTGLGGAAARSFLLGALIGDEGILLPEAIAQRLSLPASVDPAAPPRVSVDVRGRRAEVPVKALVGDDEIGPLANALIAVGSLASVQTVSDLPDRVTRVAVDPRSGAEPAVRRALVALAGDRATVAPVHDEIAALEQAVAPNGHATSLFAAISVLVGLLFTFNAMLLTMPERRRAVAELRVQGYDTRQIVAIVGFQALALGAAASGIGLLLGDVLSRAAAENPPSYLSFAFPLGTHRVVPLSTLLLAWAGGVFMTCLVAAGSLLDLRNTHPTTAIADPQSEPGNSLPARTGVKLAAGAAVVATAASLLVLRAPSGKVAGIPGDAVATIGLLGITVATLMLVPFVFQLIVRLLDRPARHMRMNSLVLALRALRSTSIRSLALVTTGAIAVFGNVTNEGAHRDLVNGLDRNFADYLSSGDLWVTTGGDENSLTTQSFPAGDAVRRLRSVPAVKDVRLYYGGMLDIDGRRTWIIGRPSADRAIIPPSQLEEGNLATATELLRRGGWVAVSRVLADALRTGIDRSITLPTPSGMRRYRIAATLTNLGWASGAVILNAADYRRDWSTDAPSAIELDLRAGADPAVARRQAQAALGPDAALRVQTRAEREHQFQTLARQGLARLTQISVLLSIAAALAVAAAMGAAIWQRRIPLARMRIDGFEPGRLWATIMLEAGIVLGVGCGIGAVMGTYAHLLASRWLTLTTGYPAPFEVGVVPVIATCLFVGMGALAVTAVPGVLAANTSPRVGLQEQ